MKDNVLGRLEYQMQLFAKHFPLPSLSFHFIHFNFISCKKSNACVQKSISISYENRKYYNTMCIIIYVAHNRQYKRLMTTS